MIKNKQFHGQLSKVSSSVKIEMEWSADIVDKINFLLKKKGMTHRDLAKTIGCNETQIIRWTKGFPNYTLSSLAKISDALGEPLIFTSKTKNENVPVHYYNMEPERTLMVCEKDENKHNKD